MAGVDAVEHRRGERIQSQLPVTLVGRNTQPLPGEIINLSSGGALIRLPDDARPPGGIIKLRFRAGTSDPAQYIWSALVVRQDGNHIGVMFDRLHLNTLRGQRRKLGHPGRSISAPATKHRTSLGEAVVP